MSAQVRGIQVREAHNLKLMHRDEVQSAEIARPKLELEAAQANLASPTNHQSNRLQVAEATLVKLANLCIQVEALQ